ncbi:MAG TPA: hypothetical protein VGC41_28020, partial [Kofleriaceae bacterium]
MDSRNLRHKVERGELVRLLYRLGRQHASGVLTVRALPADPVVARAPSHDDSGGTRDAFGRMRDESGRVAQGTTYIGRNPLLSRENAAPRGNTFIGRNPLLGREIPGFPSPRAATQSDSALPPPPPGSPNRAAFMRARTQPPPVPAVPPRARVAIPIENGVVDRRASTRSDSTATPNTRGEVFVLRRGAIVLGDGELAKRTMIARLVRLVSLERCHVVFEGGVGAYPPGVQQTLSLGAWARTHLEAQLDNTLAE